MKAGKMFKILVAAVFVMVTVQANAYSIIPSDADWVYAAAGSPPLDHLNPGTDEIATLTGQAIIYEYYRNDGTDEQENVWWNYYDTEWFLEDVNESDDYDAATISYTGIIGSDPSIECPDCYLIVKDGNHDPRWYLFDIGDWNGTDDIVMTGFWPEVAGAGGAGSISHVAIFGASAPIPEPATMLLFGTGLIGLAGLRLRRKNK